MIWRGLFVYDKCSICFKDHYLLYATLEVLSTIRGLRRSSEQIVILMFIQAGKYSLLLFPASLLLTMRSGPRSEMQTLIGAGGLENCHLTIQQRPRESRLHLTRKSNIYRAVVRVVKVCYRWGTTVWNILSYTRPQVTKSRLLH